MKRRCSCYMGNSSQVGTTRISALIAVAWWNDAEAGTGQRPGHSWELWTIPGKCHMDQWRQDVRRHSNRHSRLIKIRVQTMTCLQKEWSATTNCVAIHTFQGADIRNPVMVDRQLPDLSTILGSLQRRETITTDVKVHQVLQLLQVSNG